MQSLIFSSEFLREGEALCDNLNPSRTLVVATAVSVDSAWLIYFPQDAKQFLAIYNNEPINLIQAIVHAKTTGKDFVSKVVLSCEPEVVGVYRLAMKLGVYSVRASAM